MCLCVCVCVRVLEGLQQFSDVDISPDSVGHALVEPEPHVTVAHRRPHGIYRTLLTCRETERAFWVLAL